MSDALKELLDDCRNEEQQAELLGKTVRTIRHWRKRGEGPPYTRNGKVVIYRGSWTREWLQSGKQSPPRERGRRRRRDDIQATA